MFFTNINFVSSVGIHFSIALSLVKMRVLSKGIVSFHLKLKASWKYINTNKNIKVLRVYLNCTRTISFKHRQLTQLRQ